MSTDNRAHILALQGAASLPHRFTPRPLFSLPRPMSTTNTMSAATSGHRTDDESSASSISTSTNTSSSTSSLDISEEERQEFQAQHVSDWEEQAPRGSGECERSHTISGSSECSQVDSVSSAISDAAKPSSLVSDTPSRIPSGGLLPRDPGNAAESICLPAAPPTTPADVADAKNLSTTNPISQDNARTTVPDAKPKPCVEEQLTEKALSCAKLAAKGGPPIKTLTTLQGEEMEKEVLEGIRNRIAGARGTISKAAEMSRKVMRPSLYKDMDINGLMGDIAALLTVIEEQQTYRPDDGAVDITGVPRRVLQPIKLMTPTILEIDEPDQVSSLVDAIMEFVGLDSREPRLSIDLEGVKLGRSGDISILQVYPEHTETVFLVDVAKLQAKTFHTAGHKTSATSGDILSSPVIKKLFFDCRTDSDALYHLFGIPLAGVIDTQLHFLATRTKPSERKKMLGLTQTATYRQVGLVNKDDKAKFISMQNWGQASMVLSSRVALMEKADEGGEYLQEFREKVDNRKARFGGYEYCAERPIHLLVKRYCAADVIMLKPIYDYTTNHEAWNGEWVKRVQVETEKRLSIREMAKVPKEREWWTAVPEGWIEIDQVDRWTGQVIKKK